MERAEQTIGTQVQQSNRRSAAILVVTVALLGIGLFATNRYNLSFYPGKVFVFGASMVGVALLGAEERNKYRLLNL